MRKTEKILIILLLVLTLILVIPKLNLTGKSVIEKHAYTKAICDEKGYCEDFFIECEEKNIVGFTPTGYAIQTENAPENLVENFCD
ncbi:MAG: hypothetical protein Q8Q04_02465 [archaeon]|nr:hypothetical protein [archaeon]